MPRRFPPLNPLRAFVVVARTENLTSAAQKLHVTQSAVSRQIGVLEEYLGMELFRRERHGVTLTRAGRSYAELLIPAFDSIADATEQLVKEASRGALRVRTYTSLAAKWLIPRLSEFRNLHPNIDVRITNGVQDVDFDRDPVDVAIQFGSGHWPRVQTDLLFHDRIEPVCSPEYLEQHAPDPNRREQLLQRRLLVSRYWRSDWDSWLAGTNRPPLAKDAEMTSFGSSLLTWQAAMEGLGVAVGQSALLAHEFKSGQLVRPFAQPVKRAEGYYLVRPKLQRESRKVSVFRDWLLTLGN